MQASRWVPSIAKACSVEIKESSSRRVYDPRYQAAIGRVGAYRQQARNNTRDTTAAAREAVARNLRANLVAEVDPLGLLDPMELERRVEAGRRAHFLRLGLRSQAVRAAKRARQLADGAS